MNLFRSQWQLEAAAAADSEYPISLIVRQCELLTAARMCADLVSYS